MQFENLQFSKHTRFSVENVVDYHVKGTFDPNAVCDTEYYGYRETTFDLTGVSNKVQSIGYELWLPETDKEYLDDFSKHFDNNLTLIVQNAIDDKQGELQ